MRKVLIGFVVVIVALAIYVSSAQADGTVGWSGNGSNNLPCSGGAHWVLSPAAGITGATLIVNGQSYGMSQSGNGGSWSADSGPLGSQVSASVSYTGPGDPSDHLQLSHCLVVTDTPTPTMEATETLVSTTEVPTGPSPTATVTAPRHDPTSTLRSVKGTQVPQIPHSGGGNFVTIPVIVVITLVMIVFVCFSVVKLFVH